MECPRGSYCRESTHQVKTMDKALEWYPEALESHLPITVTSQVASDGRRHVKVHDLNDNLIFTRG